MGAETTVPQAASIFEKIAMSLDWPSLAVELSFIILTMIFILVILVAVFAILRIRKELISLNFKMGYIARVLKREIEGPGFEKESEKTEKPSEEETFKEEWRL